MDGSDGYSPSLIHSLRLLPQQTLWFTGGSWYTYRFPRVQNSSAVSGRKERGPVHNLSGPEQGVLRLGKGHIHGDPRGLWHWTLGLPHP